MFSRSSARQKRLRFQTESPQRSERTFVQKRALRSEHFMDSIRPCDRQHKIGLREARQ
jgi:hypothetical protein